MSSGCTEETLDAGGPVLVVFENATYEQGEVELFPGDSVVLFTDGVTEVANPSGEEFGERRLIERVKATAAASAEELQQTVIRNVSQFCRGHFHDDITVVAIRVRTN